MQQVGLLRVDSSQRFHKRRQQQVDSSQRFHKRRQQQVETHNLVESLLFQLNKLKIKHLVKHNFNPSQPPML